MDPITTLLGATPTLLLIYLLADKFGPRLIEAIWPKPEKKTTEDRLIEVLEKTANSNAQLSTTMSQLQDTMSEHGSVLREISEAVAHLYGYLQLQPPNRNGAKPTTRKELPR
jgi:hypothetical protein